MLELISFAHCISKNYSIFQNDWEKINWRKLVLYYMYHTRALCTYYVVMMHCILIIHVSKIAKQNMSLQSLRPTFSYNKQNSGVQTAVIFH